MAQLTINTDEVTAMISSAKSKITPQEFDKKMNRLLYDLAQRSPTQIRKAIQKSYVAKTPWIKKSIGRPKYGGSSGNLYVKIPLQGEKGKIGSEFPTQNGSPGWYTPKYKIAFQEIKGKTSILPAKMGSYGGQPPFRNTKAKKLNGLVFTRKLYESKAQAMRNRAIGGKITPIERVSGVAVPQMPMNLAANDTVDNILNLAEKRVINHFGDYFG